MEKKDKALLTTSELAEYLNIGESTARNLLRDPANNFTVRIGKKIFAHKESVDKWLKNKIM
jgi:excisionase family DNA binding protein